MTGTIDVAALVELQLWLLKRGEPNSGMDYEGGGPFDWERARSRRARVTLHGSDATFIADNFHGERARALATALQSQADALAANETELDLLRKRVDGLLASLATMREALERLVADYDASPPNPPDETQAAYRGARRALGGSNAE